MMALVALAVLLLVGSAEAQTFSCPTNINLNAAPYGTCIGCINTAGPIDFCPVNILGNGQLGCGCLGPGIVAMCPMDPNVQRCGGVLPFCSPLGICNLNTSTICFAAGTDVPAYAPDCYVMGTGLVNPFACRCYTTTVRRPWSAEQKALFLNYANRMREYVTTATLIISRLPNAPIRFVMDVMLPYFFAEQVRAQIIANDPPDCTYTQIASPYPSSILVFTRDNSLKTNQWDKFDQWYASHQKSLQALQAARRSVERYECAVNEAAPAWAEAQLDNFNLAMVILQPLLAEQAAIQRGFVTDPRWLARPPVADLSADLSPFGIVDELDAMVAADLYTQP